MSGRPSKLKDMYSAVKRSSIYAVPVSVFLALFLAAFFVTPPSASGSQPVPRTIKGCVIEAQVFDIWLDEKTNKPIKAYWINVEGGRDFTPYEGKTISLDGYLLPGDHFAVKKGAVPVVIKDTCDPDDRKIIEKEIIMRYRIAGYRAARKGDFDEGLRWTNKALDMDRTLCGTYLDRANIHYLKGDSISGSADIKTIRDKACVDPKGLNFLVIEEIGAILEKTGKKSEAKRLYRLGLDSCDSDICRKSMKNAMQK